MKPGWWWQRISIAPREIACLLLGCPPHDQHEQPLQLDQRRALAAPATPTTASANHIGIRARRGTTALAARKVSMVETAAEASKSCNSGIDGQPAPAPGGRVPWPWLWRLRVRCVRARRPPATVPPYRPPPPAAVVPRLLYDS
jgi:hypothetical protein